MNKRSKVLLLAVFVHLSYIVQCHELLFDFLNFQDQNSLIQLSKTCADHLKIVKSGIKEQKVWALKVQDASGKATSGFMWGNNFWLGVERACHLLNVPPKISLIKSANRKMHQNMTEIASKVPVEYRMFYASHISTMQFDADLFNKSVLHVGLCFPKACQDSDADAMAVKIFRQKFQDDIQFGSLEYLGSKTLVVRKNFLSEPLVMSLL